MQRARTTEQILLPKRLPPTHSWWIAKDRSEFMQNFSREKDRICQETTMPIDIKSVDQIGRKRDE